MALEVVLIESRYDYLPIWERHKQFLPEDSYLHLRTDINSIQEYNNLLCSIDFWRSIDSENVLIIQHDSNLLRTGIEQFYKYDYIGAPIAWIPFPAMNGGLSFRHKSAMIKCLKTFEYNGMANEDMYFCNALQMLKAKLPTKEIAQSFSCETIFNTGSLGYHAIEKYLNNEECTIIKNQYI